MQHRHEFYCEDCKEHFEVVLIFTEYKKGRTIKCPKCGGKHTREEVTPFLVEAT
jgi:putative FmdB family regulatory protein